MNKHTINRLAVVAGLTVALGLAAPAGGSAQRSSPYWACPEQAGVPCPWAPGRSAVDKRPRQGPMIQPRPELDPRGEQVWRSGGHLMQ
jgi:hypothetical protein